MVQATIVIPVYNEEEILEKNVKILAEKFKDFEIIIVDNGSTDSTPLIGRKLEKLYRNVKFFRIDRKGPGRAFKIAVLNAKTEKIISLDADLTVDYSFFVRECVKLLDSYEMVIGSKKIGIENRNLIRVLMSNVFIYMARFLLGLRFTDYSIGAKGYRRSLILKNIKEIDDWTFYPIKLAYLSKNTVEIPVNCYDRRKSRFNLFKEVLYRFKNLILFALKMRLRL